MLEIEVFSCSVLVEDSSDTDIKRVFSGEKISEQPFYHVSEFMGDVKWMGQMNALSKEHVRWGIIYEAAQASEKKDVGSAAALTSSVPLSNSMITSAEYEPLTVRQVVLASFFDKAHLVALSKVTCMLNFFVVRND